MIHVRNHLRSSVQLFSSTTHQVLNQATPLSNYNAFNDPALQQGLSHYDAEWGYTDLSTLGQKVGSLEWQEKSLNANNNGPKFTPFDRFGHRIESVAFQQDYHSLMALGLSSGAASFAWQDQHRGKKGAHVIRGGLMYLMYQLNPGVCCPITMSFAAVPALEAAAHTNATHGTPSFVQELTTKLCVPDYDGTNGPLSHKLGATVGMSMTEKQGGSDVRANTTTAVPLATPAVGEANAPYHLTGHKWFTSAPMSDAFLTLAHTEQGVSCFVVPRWLPTNPRPDSVDGSVDGGTPRRNVGFQLQRLKDKMGDKSNASSEVEYRQAIGYLVGPEGRGIRTIVDMVTHTRLDCIIGSAALMRQCAQLAHHHCHERHAFGKPLVQQPLMRCVLADLALETESAMLLWMRLAAALDRCAPPQDEEQEQQQEQEQEPQHGTVRQHEAAFVRLGTAVAKYWVCKRATLVAYEAMECHGGNGYVEEHPMAALFRQAPLNGIWEGSGNVICLDVLRGIVKEPHSTRALLAELHAPMDLAKEWGGNCYSATVQRLEKELRAAAGGSNGGDLEVGARHLVDRLAVCLTASVLMQDGDPVVAQCFLKTRLPAVASSVPHNVGAMASVLTEEERDHLIQRLQVDGSQ